MTTTGVALYRSVRRDEFAGGPVVDGHAVSGVLYPSFEDTPLPNGRTRLADVRPERNSAGEEFVNPGAGASLFDRKNPHSFPQKLLVVLHCTRRHHNPGVAEDCARRVQHQVWCESLSD
jgi:hypothetical protein